MQIPFFYSAEDKPAGEEAYDWRSDTILGPGGEEARAADGGATGDEAHLVMWRADDDEERDPPLVESEGDDADRGDELPPIVFEDEWESDDDNVPDDIDDDLLVDLDLPDFDEEAQQTFDVNVDGRVESTDWRRSWVDSFIVEQGAVTPSERRLLERIVAESNNPAATLRHVGNLLADGAAFDEIEACFELRLAWEEHGELGTAMPYRTPGAVQQQLVDLALTWKDSLRIIRAFSSMPSVDEFVSILEALHRTWNQRYRALRTRCWRNRQADLNSLPRFFATYAVETLEAHCDPFYWADPA